MSYKIIVDSCCDLTDEMRASGVFISVPLSLRIDDAEVVDDENLNQAELLRAIAGAAGCPGSACPSPGDYLARYDCGADRVYVVTLTSKLSGSYASAMTAADLYMQEHPDAQLRVFDSRSASAGETLIAMKIMELEAQGMEFEALCKAVYRMIALQETIFVLEDLSFLQKNGRLTGLKAVLAKALHVYPILGATPEGTIQQVGMARGYKAAMTAFCEQIVRRCQELNAGRLVMAQCNCADRAEALAARILEKLPDLEIHTVCTGGISTLYAGNKGLIVSL